MHKIQNRKPIQELSLIDDFLFTEAMLNRETAELVIRLILERALGISQTEPLLSGSYRHKASWKRY
ncbi:MAG: hypothetical protein K1W00_06035 [Lachnospiraceae bacterium]